MRIAHVIVALSLSALSLTADAATGVIVNGVDIEDATGDGWTYSAGQLTLTGGFSYSISGSNNNVSVLVQVDEATANPVNIEITDLKLDYGSVTGSPFRVSAGTAVNLTINGENYFRGGWKGPGLSVPMVTEDDCAELNITAESSGSLTAIGGFYSAGIGGGGVDNAIGAGMINIYGGTINVTGGMGGAGIGGGGEQGLISVMIESGSVNTTGGVYGAGIGGGYKATMDFIDDISIIGGYVNAVGGPDPLPEQGAGGAGIGCGRGGSSSGVVSIRGGVVIASGAPRAAGIGGACDDTLAQSSSGPWVEIYEGTVTATAGEGGAAGIGGGYKNFGSEIEVSITGGSVKAVGSDGAENIGNGIDGYGVVLLSSIFAENQELISQASVYCVPPEEFGFLSGGRVEISITHENNVVYNYIYDGTPHDADDPYCYLYLPVGEYDFMLGAAHCTGSITYDDENSSPVFNFTVTGTVSEKTRVNVFVNGVDVGEQHDREEDGWDFDRVGNILTFFTGKDYLVSGSSTNVQLQFGGDGTRSMLTISNLCIDVSGVTNAAATHIANGQGPTFTLVGSNYMRSSSTYPGVSVFGEVTIRGDGILVCEGHGGAAAIGGELGSRGYGVGKIEIEGGTVIAHSFGMNGVGGAGIGGGYEYQGGISLEVSITNANVTATADCGAGIGIGPRSTSGANISISGGNVVARGGAMNPGIGAGSGCVGGEVNIDVSGGTIMAYGGNAGSSSDRSKCAGAGIGTGAGSMSLNITLRKGKITATAGRDSNVYVSAIGAPFSNRNSPYTGVKNISATGYPNVLKLGTSMNSLYFNWSSGDTGSPLVKLRDYLSRLPNYGYSYVEFPFEQAGVVINEDDIASGGKEEYGWVYNDKILTLTGRSPLLNISGTASNVQIVARSGTENTVLFTDFSAESLNKNDNYSGVIVSSNAVLNLSMSGLNIFIGSGESAGISVPPGATLNITTNKGYGKLSATGGPKGGAGIGGKLREACGNVNIYGGTVEANGGGSGYWFNSGGAGIGGGASGDGGTVHITGGSVLATRYAYNASAIGGGSNGDVGTLSNGEAGGNQPVWKISLPVMASIDIDVTNSLPYVYSYRGAGHDDGYVYLYLPNGRYDFNSGFNTFGFTVNGAGLKPEYTMKLDIDITSVTIADGAVSVSYDSYVGGKKTNLSDLGSAGTLHLLKSSSPTGPWDVDSAVSVSTVPVSGESGVLEYEIQQNDSAAFFRVCYEPPAEINE